MSDVNSGGVTVLVFCEMWPKFHFSLEGLGSNIIRLSASNPWGPSIGSMRTLVCRLYFLSMFACKVWFTEYVNNRCNHSEPPRCLSEDQRRTDTERSRHGSQEDIGCRWVNQECLWATLHRKWLLWPEVPLRSLGWTQRRITRWILTVSPQYAS